MTSQGMCQLAPKHDESVLLSRLVSFGILIPLVSIAMIYSLPLPPGKLGLPLLSDGIFKMPKQGSAYFAAKHAKYGEIYKERIFFGKAVVVSGYENVRKIMRGEHDLTEGDPK